MAPTRSLGVAGGFFYDWGWWFNLTARFYPGWDLSGRYLSIFYDFHSHGTACSSAAAGRGRVEYDLGYLGRQRLRGVAPGAKILGVKGLWWGMVEPGMMWAAGFDVDRDGRWYWTGQKRAHVISNSWGISYFIYDFAAFGFDFESAFVNGLAAPGFLDRRYPGIVIVQAGGNGGYGFGTVTSPGASVGAITVGAVTCTHVALVWVPLRGYHWGDVVSWSLRGPAPAGYVKPDVVNVGAFGIMAYPVGWGVFGGTSMAAPLTAGVAALVLSAIADKVDPAAVDPFLVRQAIASTAADIGYTPFTAGHGLVNATAAVMAARAYYGLPAPKAPVALVGADSRVSLGASWDFQWRVSIPLYFGYWLNNLLTERWEAYLVTGAPQPPLGMTSLYLETSPGGIAVGRITVTSPGPALAISARAVTLAQTLRRAVTVEIHTERYCRLLTAQELGVNETALRQADVVVFRMAYGFSAFDRGLDYWPDVWPALAVLSWEDPNGDGKPSPREVAVINFGYQLHTAVEVPVARLGAKLADGRRLLVAACLVPLWQAPAVVPATIEVTAYVRALASDVEVRPASATVRPRDSVTLTVRVAAPRDAAPTAHERAVLLSINGTTYVVPLSYIVRAPVPVNATYALTRGRTDSWYNASEVRGGNDWAWRYESGDWRAYYIRTPVPAGGLHVRFGWRCANTSMVVYAVAGDGFFAGYRWNQGISFHWYMGRFIWTGTGGRTEIVTLPSSSFAVGRDYRAYPVERARDFIILARTSMYGGCQAREEVAGAVTPFKSIREAVPPAAMPGPVRAFLSSPPLEYDAAFKLARVQGGGFLVPALSYGRDLAFSAYFIKTPLFADFVAWLYAPKHATWVRWGGASWPAWPWYVVEATARVS